MRFPELPEDIVKHVTELRGLDLSWRDPNNPNLQPAPEGSTYFLIAMNSSEERRMLVDKDDYQRLLLSSWQLHPRRKSGKYDASTIIDGQYRSLSREVMRVYDRAMPVHHVNHDPLDNRKRNLVLCADFAAHARLHRLMGSPEAEK